MMCHGETTRGGWADDECLLGQRRAVVTVAGTIPTSLRGLAAEVPIDHTRLGLDEDSAVNCYGLHTVPQTMLSESVGAAGETTMHRVCAAVRYALGC